MIEYQYNIIGDQIKKLIVSRQPIQLTLNLYHEKHVANI